MTKSGESRCTFCCYPFLQPVHNKYVSGVVLEEIESNPMAYLYPFDLPHMLVIEKLRGLAEIVAVDPEATVPL